MIEQFIDQFLEILERRSQGTNPLLAVIRAVDLIEILRELKEKQKP